MKKGLGRGLESLFSIYNEDEEKNNKIEETQSVSLKNEIEKEDKIFNDGIVELDIKLIDPNKDQPRKHFDVGSLKELSDSIKQHGVIQPIIVSEDNGRYTIVAGERRFRASLVAGKKTIPSIIKKYNEREISEIALIENLQREDLNPIEAGKAIKKLMNKYNLTQEDIAERIGKSRPLVANTLRLLSLSPFVIEMIEKNLISAGHGKCLVSIENFEDQKEIANYVIEHKLSVRELENYLKTYQKEKNEKDKIILNTKEVQSLELLEMIKDMQRILGTKINIVGNDNKGKIIINYFNKDDLDRIYKFVNLKK